MPRFDVALVFLALCFSAFMAEAQVAPQAAPTPVNPGATLTPEQLKVIRAAVDDWMVVQRQMDTRPPLENLHALLDRALSGSGLPDPATSSFKQMFVPSRDAMTQFLDTRYASLDHDLRPGNQSAAALLELDAPRAEMSERPAGLSLWRVAWIGDRLEPHGSIATGRRFDSPPHFLRAQASSGGAGSASASGDLADGTHARLNMTVWEDTDTSVADGVQASMEFSKSDQVATGSMGFEMADTARVDRCPSADGLVRGVAESRGGVGTNVVLSSGVAGSYAIHFAERIVAKAHDGDDAILKDADLDWDANVTVQDREGVFNEHAAGTAVWYIHPDDEIIQTTSCSVTRNGVPVGGGCSNITDSLSTTGLRRAYVRAEKQWNFSSTDGDGRELKSSKCVTVEFMPKSKTVPGMPSQTIGVKAQLLTMDGRHPTWGTFDELTPIGGDVQQNGARTAPGAPAELSYKAPDQPWPLSNPPGFDVLTAKSRAGKFEGVFDRHSTREEYEWLLKPGPKLTIHDKWESHSPTTSLVSEATFPIELMMDADGTLSGQAVVPRRHRQTGVVGPAVCQDTGEWTETWQATATYDETGMNLIVKLRFRSSEKHGKVVCPANLPSPSYTEPGFSSDGVRTPMDNFSLPAQDGAAKQFVFAFGGVTSTTIDVKLEMPDGGAQ